MATDGREGRRSGPVFDPAEASRVHDISNIDLFSYLTGIRPATEPSRVRPPRRRRLALMPSVRGLRDRVVPGVRRRPVTATS